VIFVVANFSHSAKNISKKEYSVKIPLLKEEKTKIARKKKELKKKFDRNRHNCLQHERKGT
jgi:hypothetical protein